MQGMALLQHDSKSQVFFLLYDLVISNQQFLLLSI